MTPSVNPVAKSALRGPRRYDDTTWWDPYVADIADEATYLRRKFRQDVTDPATGLDAEGLKELLASIVADGRAAGEPWRVTKAKCFAAQATRQAIDVSPFDFFPAIAVWNRNDLPIRKVVNARVDEANKVLPDWARDEWKAGNADGRWLMWQDFSHSVPDWRAILALGFPGMKARLSAIAGQCRMQNAEWGMRNASTPSTSRAPSRWTPSSPPSTASSRRGGKGLAISPPKRRRRGASPGKSPAWNGCATDRRRRPTTC